MSESRQSPRNGLAKILNDADPDASFEEVVEKKEKFACPACGWEAELQRSECMVCEYDQELTRKRRSPEASAENRTSTSQNKGMST